MKIDRLKIANFKNIATFEVAPDGHHVRLEGRNGAGKSSVLDAIMAALKGKEGVPKDPVLHGQDEALIELDMRKYRVRMEFDKDRVVSRYRVEDADGDPIKGARLLLDAMIDESTIDATKFERMSPLEQRKHILKVAGVDMEKWERQLQGLELTRKEKGRELETVTGAWKAAPKHVGIQEQEVDTAAVQAELEKLRSDESTRVSHQHEIGLLIKDIDRIDMEIAKLQARRVQQSELLAKEQDDLSKLSIVDPVRIAALRTQIAESSQINKKVGENRRKAELSGQMARAEEAAKACDEAVQAKRKELLAKIAALDLSKLGIEVTENAVMLHGRLFATASTGQRMLASAEIAMMGAPELRVLFFPAGALLDDEALAKILERATQKGFQCLVEITKAGSDLKAIVLEEYYGAGE